MRLCTSLLSSRSFPLKSDSGARGRSVYLPPADAVVLEGLDEFLGGSIDIDKSATSSVDAGSLQWADVDAYAQYYGMQSTPAADPDAEDENWVPGDVARLTTSFRKQHLRHVPLALIRTFLLDLNGVWKRRLNSIVAGLKDKYVVLASGWGLLAVVMPLGRHLFVAIDVTMFAVLFLFFCCCWHP